MIEKEDARKVVEVIGNNLIGVSHDSNNFQNYQIHFGGILHEVTIKKEHLE